MTMIWLVFLLSLLSSSVKCRESMELLPTMGLKPPMAVQVETQHLKNVANSVVMAESWLKNHVLSHYPSTNITTVVVGHSILCSKRNLGLVLPSVKNIHHSLTRWGLQNEIKVTASLSSDCLDSLSETHIKPLITFLQEIGSPMNVIQTSSRKDKPLKRKLLFINISNNVVPFPPNDNVIPPSNSPSGSYSNGSPLPPLVGTVTPTAPVAAPPYGLHLPPCEPSHGGGPVGSSHGSGPVGRHHHGVWCVAKPSVPAETLQEALDYACGEGDADCEAIQEEGSCYFPDNVVAHASYAFNSYWQKTKSNGGTCGFGGTAMLINSDPSYAHCRFVLT